MFSNLWSTLRSSTPGKPTRGRSQRARLSLEALEERTLLSGGPAPSGGGSGSTGGPGSQVVVQSTGGGSGSTSGTGSGNTSLSGPGYPLVSTSGATRTDATTLSQTTQGVVIVPLTGTPGGPGSTLAVVPVCMGGTSTIGGDATSTL